MRPRSLGPVLVLALLVGGLAWRAEAQVDGPGEEPPDSTLATPVLSVRRVPVWLQRPGGAERLELALQEFLDGSPQPDCLVVQSGGRRILSLGATDALVPASNQKLLVSTAALEQLGPDAVFTTTAAASTDVAADGTLEGDLWLLGGGDPLLATEDFLAGFEHQPQTHTALADLADSLADRGVVRVTGGVVGDDTRYDNARTVEGWPDRGLTRSRPGPLTALSVNRGFESYPTDPDEDVTPQPADDPPLQAAEVFAGLLEERDITVEGSATAGVAPDDLLALESVDSAPLSEIVAHTMIESDNTAAELLLKEIGLARAGEGSTEAGSRAVLEILDSLELPTDGVVVADGSGLHDEDRVTCDLLARLLARAGDDSDLAAALPVAGESGTLSERFLDSFVVGRVHAKTGFLNEATALSGYVDTLSGLDMVFAYVANGDDLDQDDVDLQDELVNALVRYPEGPAVDELAPRVDAAGAPTETTTTTGG